MRTTQWYGKKVAFLGDSITDKCHVGTTKNYWQFLRDYLGVEHLVYGVCHLCLGGLDCRDSRRNLCLALTQF